MPAGGATAGFAGVAAGFVAVAGAPDFTPAEAGLAAGAAGFALAAVEPLTAAGFVVALAGVFELSDLFSDFAG